MGLLDDAIREHLELKRSRGADPEEVAREQREALDPLSDGGPSSELDLGTEERRPEQRVASDAGFLPGEETGQPRAASDHAGIEPASSEALSSDPPQVIAGPGAGDALEETVELDMKTVLDGEPVLGHEHAGRADDVSPEADAKLEADAASELESGQAAEAHGAAPGGAEHPRSHAVSHDAPHTAMGMSEQERLHFERGPETDSAPDR
jgi:hypothetical protein